MAIMESKKAGTCNICKGAIEIGTLINWDRNNGASHHPQSGVKCEPVAASAEDRALYLKTITAAFKDWDGIGSFRPMAYGDFLDAQAGRR